MGKTNWRHSKDLFEKLGQRTGLPSETITLFYAAFVAQVREEVKCKGKMALEGLGVFSVKEKPVKYCKRNGEMVSGELRQMLNFKASRTMRDFFE